MVNNEDILNDILLKMNYDTSKTLSEQDGPKFDRVGAPKTYSSASSSSTDYWKVGCKYPDKAQKPPSIDGISGQDVMINGYCYYLASSNKNAGQIVGVWVPNASDIKWFDVAFISEFVDQKIEGKDLDSFWSGFTDDQIQSIITSNLVPGTIKSFNVGARNVTGWLTKTGGSFEPSNVRYKGLFYTDTGKPYIQPEWEDRRTDWDKLVDDYGIAVQIFTALSFVALSIATGGLGGIALLATEIAIEGTLGAIMAQREWEKGNPAWGMEIVFGLSPLLKVAPGIRALKPGVVKGLTSKMGKSGLKAGSSVDDIVTFYRGLTEAEQQAFTRLVKDTSDELSEATVKKALGKALTDEVYDYARKNPDVFKDLSWYQKVWAKEVGFSGIVMLFDMAYKSYFTEELSQKERNKAAGFILSLPEELQEWVQFGIISNPEHLQKFIDDVDGIMADTEKLKANVSDSATSAAAIDMVLSKRDIYLDNPKADNKTTVPDGYVKLSYEEAEQAFADDLVDDVIEINYDGYYLLKK